MKTVRKGKKVQRVSNEEAAVMTKEGWAYCPKEEWRKKQAKIAKREARLDEQKS